MKYFAFTALILVGMKSYAAENLDFWPYEIVPIARHFELVGQPKSVMVVTKGSEGGIVKSEYAFYQDGRVKRSTSSAGSPLSIHVKLDRKGRVKEVVHGSFDTGNTRNAQTFLPKQYDKNGRIAIITSRSENFDGAVRTFHGVGVIKISYSGNVVTSDWYYKRGSEIGPLNRQRAEFDDDGNLVATCLGGEIGSVCDRSQPIREYGESGIIRVRTGSVEKTYTYENGQLASEIRMEKGSAQEEVIRYVNYKVDSCGNWVSRDVFYSSDLAGPSSIEQREIAYYKECSS